MSVKCTLMSAVRIRAVSAIRFQMSRIRICNKGMESHDKFIWYPKYDTQMFKFLISFFSPLVSLFKFFITFFSPL